jgi:4-hydroxy-3-methylbut-2-enyl diphosphate reductase
MRLAEIALEHGIPSYLIDGPQDIDAQWFHGDEVVGLTAGASAPEDLVSGCIELLQKRFNAQLEERTGRAEHVDFPLPVELREMMAAASV